jgi:UDP-GlcNAc:undecaprenyl-phosphate/decaprenyl-phosphate GlcNAc-1-phosphate transferase
MREYLLVLMVAAAVTYLSTGVVRRLAIDAGMMTAVRDRDVHAIPTPRLGGIAMFAGLCAALLVASALPLMRSVYDESRDPIALLSGAALICLLGVIDDKWEIDSLTKMAGQVLAAGVMVIQGIQMVFVPVPWGTVSLSTNEGVLLSVLIVVVTINAVNFVDGLDGLLAGIAAIGALAFFSYSFLFAVSEEVSRFAAPTLFSAVLAGCCLGFLPHNFYPARIFMGDSGSMLIGLLLAASTISLTGQMDAGSTSAVALSPALLPLVLPFAVIAVPFVDLLLAVVRRTRAGRSPFAPDKQHLHHRLLEIGHSHRRAVLIMYFWSALISFGVVAASLTQLKTALFALVVVLVAFGVFLLGWPHLSAWVRRMAADVAERKAADAATRQEQAARRAEAARAAEAPGEPAAADPATPSAEFVPAGTDRSVSAGAHRSAPADTNVAADGANRAAPVGASRMAGTSSSRPGPDGANHSAPGTRRAKTRGPSPASAPESPSAAAPAPPSSQARPTSPPTPAPATPSPTPATPRSPFS